MLQTTNINYCLRHALFNIDSKDELEELMSKAIDSPPEHDVARRQKEKSEEAKQKREAAKKRKDAQQAAIDDAAKNILELQPCVKCGQLGEEIRTITEKLRERDERIKELETSNSDLLSSVTAKRSRIVDLEEQLQVKKAHTASDSSK